MNKFKITTDLTPRVTKPTSSEVGSISQSLNIVTEVTIEEFSAMMQQGFTWSCGIFNGSRSNANWIQQQVFALDFDSGVTPETILEILEPLGLTPNVIYTSFSDTPELRKFRLVFFLDTLITDVNLRNNIQLGLMKIVKDSDKACKDSARLYYGGKSSEILSTSRITLTKLLQVIDCQTVADDNGRTRKLAENDSSYSSIIGTDVFCQKEEIRDFDLKKLEIEVQIFKDFVEGKWLTHPQLFGLATSLHWIRGGVKLMKDTMAKYNSLGLTQYNQNNFAILPYVKFKKYQPQSLENYSPYVEDYAHQNCITAVKEQRGVIEIIEQSEKITLKDAERLMQDEFLKALGDNTKSIYLFKLPTGIGKSRMLETVSATIAFPTNSLKEEMFERVIEIGRAHV